MGAELSWVPTDYEAETTRGTYFMSRYGSDWELKFSPASVRGEGFRRVTINAKDADGSPIDWPSLGCAQLAAVLHHERMAVHGEAADVAASFVHVHCDAAQRKAAEP